MKLRLTALTILRTRLHSCIRLTALLLFTVISSTLLHPPALAAQSSCARHIDTHIHDDDSNSNLDKEILEFQQYIEESLTYRAESIRIAKKLKARISNNLPMSGADLQTLNDGVVVHLRLRKELYRFAEMHECWLDLEDTPETIYRLSPYIRLQGVMLSLSAALTLYDNYLLAISIFEEDDKLRRFLNSEDKGYNRNRDKLADITLSYNSINNRSRVRNAIRFYENKYKQLPRRNRTDNFTYLKLLITQSPSYKMTREYAPLRVLSNKLKFLDAITGDTLLSLRDEGVNIFSMLFGNTVGLIESRKGKLHGNRKIIASVKSKLKAGDILLEKTPFRLTDKFIPGHWGHAAIWIGNEQELKTLGIWDHPLVRKHHDQIIRGNSVVEALRSGVVMNPLNEFMNIDDLSVLRLNESNATEKAQIILLTLRQLGKEYDFNFDIESTDKIVCSELIYVAFTNISWPTDNTLGRFTISPDNIAVKTLEDGPLQLIMLIHDGKIIDKRPNIVMAKLLKDPDN